MSQSIAILALGDSLTEGYGLEPDAAFPAALERLLRGAVRRRPLMTSR